MGQRGNWVFICGGADHMGPCSSFGVECRVKTTGLHGGLGAAQ